MLTPFLKWVGGKRWLVESNELVLPHGFDRYIEPFLGGAAVFFALKPKKSILSDVNKGLIETYCVVRDRPEELEALLVNHSYNHSDRYYYYIRDLKIEGKIERAAQFIYLNRTCFNGIYRENLKGQFNVPRGSRNTIIFQTDDFLAWSRALKQSEIYVSDFAETIGTAGAGDLIFADPPYTVRHNKNGFVKYNQKIFSWEDQERLSNALRLAVSRGADFILTNADHQTIRELYSDFAHMRSVERSSSVAASAANRSLTTELVVSSFSSQSGFRLENNRETQKSLFKASS